MDKCAHNILWINANRYDCPSDGRGSSSVGRHAGEMKKEKLINAC